MKRFIIFAYDDYERNAGFSNIFKHASSLSEAGDIAEEAKSSGNNSIVEIYDIDTEELVTEWIRTVTGNWVKAVD